MSTKSGIKICLTLQNTQVDKTYTVHTYLFSQILFGFWDIIWCNQIGLHLAQMQYNK